jgi:hypothetical protein
MIEVHDHMPIRANSIFPWGSSLSWCKLTSICIGLQLYIYLLVMFYFNKTRVGNQLTGNWPMFRIPALYLTWQDLEIVTFPKRDTTVKDFQP